MRGAGFKPVGELHSQPFDSAFVASSLPLSSFSLQMSEWHFITDFEFAPSVFNETATCRGTDPDSALTTQAPLSSVRTSKPMSAAHETGDRELCFFALHF